MRFVVIAMMLALAACASGKKADTKALEETLRQYASVMRWGDASQAIAFIDPEIAEAKPVEPIEIERWKQVQIAGYRERPYELAGELEAVQVVQIDLVNRHTQEVRSVVDMQRWRFDPETRRWWLVTGLPDLTQRR